MRMALRSLEATDWAGAGHGRELYRLVSGAGLLHEALTLCEGGPGSDDELALALSVDQAS